MTMKGIIGLFKRMGKDKAKAEQEHRAAHRDADAKARIILNAHIDSLETKFHKEFDPLFDVGNKVIVNKFGIGKPRTSTWDGGANGLLGCIDREKRGDRIIYAEITSVRIHTSFVHEELDKFMEKHYGKFIDWAANEESLINDFDNMLDSVSRSSSLPMKYGLYYDFGFTTNVDFNPSWGLSHFAFHFIGSKEGKATFEIWDKEIKAAKLREEADKLKEENSDEIKRLRGL